jgi:serine/threonine protein kinase
MAIGPNTILGDKYRLIRQLDKGGAGTVWLCEHVSLATAVVVKLIATELALAEDGRQRFLAEARALAALRSPHVVQVLDYGVDAGTPYIVMEYLDGESLADRLLRLGRLRPEDTGTVVRHVSRAIGRAHDVGILHRDLKPTNIFITRNDDEELIQLLDFGIVKATTDAVGATLSRTTRTGTYLGTSSYMSPEQLQETLPRDQRMDIWALGVIAFECLLGQPAFIGGGLGGLVLAICFEPLPVPSAKGAVPPGFDAWFARACARNPDERFPNAREAAQEFRRLLEPGFDPQARERLPISGEWQTLVPSAFAPALPVQRVRDTLSLPPPPPVAVSAHSSTGTASSATIRPGQPRYRSWPVLLPGLFLGVITVLLVLRHLVQQPATEALVMQEVLPLRTTARLRAFGEGTELSLTLDGKPFGALPQELQDLEPGEHTVVITGSPRYRAFQSRVTLSPGVVTSIGPVKLVVAKGLAMIVPGEGAEGAEVSLEADDWRGRVPPLPVQLDIDTDQPYVLVARKAGYATYQQPLTFEDGQAQKTFSVTLSELAAPAEPRPERSPEHPGPAREAKPARAAQAPPARAAQAPPASTRTAVPIAKPTLTITSTPASYVLLDGVPVGTTPLHELPVSSGSHRVVFINGSRRETRMVESIPGQHREVSEHFLPRSRSR